MTPLISDRKTTNYLPALASLMLLAQLGLVASSTMQWHQLSRLTNKADVYAQTPLGETYALNPIDPRLKQPEVIQAFTLKALMLLFNWSGPQPNPYGHLEPDRGAEVDLGDGETVRVPTAVVASSFLFEPGFQEAMLQRMADLLPPDYFGGNVEVLLVVDALTLPEALASGGYEITVVGHRYTVRDGKLPGEREPFNKVITLQPTAVPLMPVGETLIERQVYGVRQAGLMISDLRNISETE